MKSRTLFFVGLLVALSMVLSACGSAATSAPTVVMASATDTPVPAPTAVPPKAPPKNRDLILATTTSTQDSGLLDMLIPLFEQQEGYQVKVVAVGTGQALQMGQAGNADVLLVHAPTDEKNFMAQQYGKERFLVMHNDFIIVGPTSDPAKVKGGTRAVDAFRKIAAAQSPFISRGDKSGTNTKELSLWKSAALDPATTKAAWYIQTGQGMGATLTVASEKEAYTLTDRATYLANKANLKLDILVEGDAPLLNVYHVITVNPGKWPKVNYEGALAFAKWIVSPDTQAVIGKFGLDKYGQALFIADAGKTDAQLGLP
jgi:tungstate transport system substrate-binding protein